MKILLSAFALVALFLSSAQTFAQDPLKVAPKMYKQLFENDKVRVLEVTFAPGDTIAPHSHPDHLAYVLSEGKLRITEMGKEPMEAEMQKGGVMYLPAQTHSAKNIGKTELKVLVIELKD